MAELLVYQEPPKEVDRTEEKAAAEAEVTLLEFDDILLEALGCLYNPLKIEVIKAVDKSTDKFLCRHHGC